MEALVWETAEELDMKLAQRVLNLIHIFIFILIFQIIYYLKSPFLSYFR